MNANDFNPEKDVPFTQFLRPHGRKTQVWIERPAEVIVKAKAIIEAGGRFEIEELMNGTVSATVEHHDWEREDRGPVAIELCPNGVAVPTMVDRLVDAAFTRLKEPA